MRAVGIVVVILLIVFGIGLFAGWFSLTKETVAGETRIGVGVKGSEIERDAESTKDAVKELGHKIGDAIDGEDEDDLTSVPPGFTLAGVLSSIDAPVRALTLRTADGTATTLSVEAAADVELDGLPAVFSDLQVGDRITVELRAGEMPPRAARVVAKRRQ